MHHGASLFGNKEVTEGAARLSMYKKNDTTRQHQAINEKPFDSLSFIPVSFKILFCGNCAITLPCLCCVSACVPEAFALSTSLFLFFERKYS